MGLFIRKSSIQKKLIASFFLLIVFILGILGFGLLKMSESLIEKELGLSRTEVLNQISINIEAMIQEIVSLSSIYYFNSNLQEIIQKPPATDFYERNADATKMLGVFSTINYSFENLNYYTVLYAFNGRAYSSWINEEYNFASIPDRSWYKDVIKQNGNIDWLGTYNDKAGYGTDKYVFSAARLIKNVNNDTPLGVLILNFDESTLFDTYEQALNIGGDIMIIDSNNKIISNRNKSVLSSIYAPGYDLAQIKANRRNGFTIDHKLGKLISYRFIPKVNWTIIEEVPLSAVLASLSPFKYLVLVLMCVCLLIALVVASLISLHVSLPLKSLRRHMKKVEHGNFDVTSNISRTDEIGEVSRGFNKMIATIRKLMDDLVREEGLKRKAEFEFLQAQIKPHFLYNTLNSIRFLIAMGQNESAESMLLSLSRLLSKTLHTQQEFVTIREELDYLQDYISLQSYRYPDKFDVVMDVDPDTLSCYIPKFLLQPIIENAIFHGIEPKEGKGTIVVRIAMRADRIAIDISDDGVGMEPNKGDRQPPNKEGIGLANIKERIVLHFGQQYGIAVTSEPQRGCTISIRIPRIERSPEVNEG